MVETMTVTMTTMTAMAKGYHDGEYDTAMRATARKTMVTTTGIKIAT